MKAIELVPEVATRKALNELKERLLEALKDNLIKIVFFGSRARGLFEPDSDLDILIMVKKKNHETVDRIFSIAQEIEDTILHKIAFSIHLYDMESYIKLKKVGSLLIKNIESEGLVVYERVNDN